MVQHPHGPVDGSQIAKVAAKVGLALDVETVARLSAFGVLFLTWNARINLGGSISSEELVARHFIDSFVASQLVEPGSGVVDVGSGGGLPAIPLALVRPDLRVSLFEPTGKKVAFLRAAVRELGLKERVAVHPERVSASAAMAGGPFDVAISRATLPPVQWLALGRTLVRPRGAVIVFGTGGVTDPEEPPDAVMNYGPDRRLLLYRRSKSQVDAKEERST